MKPRLLILLSTLILIGFKSDKPAYVLFDKAGKHSQYGDMLKDALKADIILFGELHNNPVCHWIQFELTRDLFGECRNNLVLGAEMFETDNTLLMQEYLSGQIKESNFEKEAKLWDNYTTDYKPLVQFARDSGLVFVPTNIPRRYAAIVSKEGFEGLEKLGDEARKLIGPLPVPYDPELNCYKQMLGMGMMGNAHTSENLPKAQAVKDATMAYFILQNRSSGAVFLHFNGAYHSDHYEGICWYLKLVEPDLKIMTISTVEQDTTDELAKESIGIADYIICVPTSMTKTY
jgi:uncharacterized iron-regulated protein